MYLYKKKSDKRNQRKIVINENFSLATLLFISMNRNNKLLVCQSFRAISYSLFKENPEQDVAGIALLIAVFFR